LILSSLEAIDGN
jgi:hypothetical protein